VGGFSKREKANDRGALEYW